jgi:hypothetical protein
MNKGHFEQAVSLNPTTKVEGLSTAIVHSKQFSSEHSTQ